MPNERVQGLIDAFRSHFQRAEGSKVPVSLRQESSQVLFTSLIEEDANPMVSVMPMMPGDFGLSSSPSGMPPGMESLMGMGMDMAQNTAPPAPQGAAMSLDEMVGGEAPQLLPAGLSDPLAGLG